MKYTYNHIAAIIVITIVSVLAARASLIALPQRLANYGIDKAVSSLCTIPVAGTVSATTPTIAITCSDKTTHYITAVNVGK